MSEESPMVFCPTCGTILLVHNPGSGFQFFCQTCPYVHQISARNQIRRKVELERKVVDDVLGGAEAWKNVDKTEAKCPHCGNNTAFFMQIQTRSADEPMTTFYKCTDLDKCGKKWKEG